MHSSNSLVFKNSFSKVLKVILEPWAEEYSIEPGTSLEFLSTGACDKKIEIEYDGEGIIIYGWSDNMKVLSDGKPIEPNFD